MKSALAQHTPANDEPPVALLPRSPLSTEPHSYYRSQLFNTQSAINPLVGATLPLLTWVSKLSNNQTAVDLEVLHQELLHEIKAFEMKVQQHGYRSNIILAARYILCSMIDEQVATATWINSDHWKNYSTLNSLHGEAWGGDRFFLILARSNEDLALNLDLLDLIYLCLSQGYMGKYRFLDQGYQQLQQLTIKLYQCLRRQHGEFDKNLPQSMKTTTSIQRDLKKHRPKSTSHKKSCWASIALIALALALGSNIYFNHGLQQQLEQSYQNILQTPLFNHTTVGIETAQ